jgi:hypothetical protein
MAEEYQQQVVGLQQAGQQYTAELQAIEGELTKNILTKMQPIVRQIGQTDNYQLIVDEQVVHFSPSHLNLTDRVIQAYNQQYPVRGPIQLPDAGMAPQAPMGLGGGDGGMLMEPEPQPSGPPTGSGADAGHAGPLPGVFYRRDGGR